MNRGPLLVVVEFNFFSSNGQQSKMHVTDSVVFERETLVWCILTRKRDALQAEMMLIHRNLDISNIYDIYYMFIEEQCSKNISKNIVLL